MKPFRFTGIALGMALMLLLGTTACSAGKAAAGQTKAGQADPSRYPDHIILNLTETPSASVAVTWRTSRGISDGSVEWAEATHGPEFPKAARTIPAATEALLSTDLPAHYHSAVIDGLEPGKTYVYRVGSGKFTSEWIQFRTPAADGPYSFIYFGDAQNDIKAMWSRVIREAYSKLPQAGFMLHAGDLINRSNSDEEWHDWFAAGSFIHAMIPSVMTPGNHEYTAGNLSRQWRPQFTLPGNGPAGLEESCYFTIYRDMLVISLNSMEGLRSKDTPQPQAEWLRTVLEEHRQPWITVTLHHPLYSATSGRDNSALRSHLQPIFEEYGVDLVLQGHDHAYARGENAMQGTTGMAAGSQVMYVVSVSGPKMYDLAPDEWMTRKARDTQLFQLITVDGNRLRYEAYTAAGALYDAFEILKENGIKTITEDIPEMPERID